MGELLVTGCGELLTLAGPSRPRVGPELRELGIVRDGAILVQDSKIVAAGRRAEVEPLASSVGECFDAGGRVVMPGFVDAHTHPVFAGSRASDFESRALGKTYQEIAVAGGGIMATVKATRAATESELLSVAERNLQWMLLCGTTALEAKTGYGLTLEEELRLLRVLSLIGPQTVVPTVLGAHALPPEFPTRQDYVEMVVEELLPKAQGTARFCDAFIEQGYFTADDAEQIAARAHSLGIGLRLHVDQLTDGGGAALAAILGAKTADHLEQTGEPGIQALAKAGVQPVLLPGSVYGLGLTKFPAARTMISAGLGIVLATDFNPGSSPTPSIPMAISLAVTHMGMTAAEAISAATINAAFSLDCGNDRGSLEAGKRAEFVVLEMDDHRELGCWFGFSPVTDVYLGGSWRVRGRSLVVD